MIMITTRTWAIAGVSAALILVPAGASYAVTTASDDGVPAAVERVQAREQLHADQQTDYGMRAGGAFGAGYGDQTRDHMRDQMRDPAQAPSGDYTRDQMRDQLRDTEDCDGDGPIGDGLRAGDDGGRGGMMGGHGSGR